MSRTRTRARSDNLPALRADPAEALPIPVRASGQAPALAVDLVGAFLAGRSTPTSATSTTSPGSSACPPPGPPPSPDLRLRRPGERPGPRLKTDLVRRGLATATIARRLAALRSMVKFARTLGRVAWSLETGAPRVETYTETAGPGDSGWRAILGRAKADAGSGKPKAVRDLAIVRLLHDLALRRAEVVELDLSDLDLEAGTASMLGKGRSGRERLTLPGPVRRDLGAWVDVRGRCSIRSTPVPRPMPG